MKRYCKEGTRKKIKKEGRQEEKKSMISGNERENKDEETLV